MDSNHQQLNQHLFNSHNSHAQSVLSSNNNNNNGHSNNMTPNINHSRRESNVPGSNQMSHSGAGKPPLGTTQHIYSMGSYLGSQMNILRTESPREMDYEPKDLKKVKEIKTQIDGVIDNLNTLVHHVVQREEMKIRQHTNPMMKQAKRKIISQEKKMREVQDMDTSEH